MARLRNRMVKAEFWTDPELLRWPRDKRETYRGLWAMAEDSGCLEDDPFGWKLVLWPSPMDADITVTLLSQWRDELIGAGKLVPYEADGKCYLWLKNFSQHEHPKNPQSPNLPLPAWVQWVVTKDEKGRTRSSYVTGAPPDCPPTETVVRQYCDATVTPVQSCTVLSSPDQSSTYSVGAPQSDAAPVDNSPDEFADIDFGEEPSEAEPKQEVSTDNRTPGQQLVAFYVDERTKAGSKPTDRQVGILAQTVGAKLAGGSKPENVKEAIRRMVGKGKPPGVLAAFVDEVEAERVHVHDFRPFVPPVVEGCVPMPEEVKAMMAGLGKAVP